MSFLSGRAGDFFLGDGMRIVLGMLIGGGIGFAVGHFGRCAAGTCPLTSNPWISALVGASVGFMMAMS